MAAALRNGFFFSGAFFGGSILGLSTDCTSALGTMWGAGQLHGTPSKGRGFPVSFLRGAKCGTIIARNCLQACFVLAEWMTHGRRPAMLASRQLPLPHTDIGRTRTCNAQLRGPMPYPLGREALKIACARVRASCFLG